MPKKKLQDLTLNPTVPRMVGISKEAAPVLLFPKGQV
jgi:hypothetical protein